MFREVLGYSLPYTLKDDFSGSCGPRGLWGTWWKCGVQPFFRNIVVDVVVRRLITLIRVIMEEEVKGLAEPLGVELLGKQDTELIWRAQVEVVAKPVGDILGFETVGVDGLR